MESTLTKYAQAIKAELALELAKQGSTLAQFDQELASVNTGEGVLKIAAAETSMLHDAFRGGLNAGASIPDLALKLSLAGGAAAGLTADEMDNSVNNLNKSLQSEREKIKLVQRLTANLKREHGLR